MKHHHILDFTLRHYGLQYGHGLREICCILVGCVDFRRGLEEIDRFLSDRVKVTRYHIERFKWCRGRGAIGLL